MEACAECSRICLSLHRTKLDPHPIVSSFFKVMFGNQFSEMLIMPPKFARTIKAMEGRSTYLEDTTGQKWKVDLSNVKGSLAFLKGWREFSVDHGIELGDFLAFHYFKGSHFSVQIFGRSGCEKPMIYSGKNYQNKRAKLTTDSTPISPIDSSCKDSPAKECLNFCMDSGPDADVSQRKDDLRSVEKIPEISVNIPREGNTNKRLRDISTDFLVESFMTNRNKSFSREDDCRDHLFDLSIFEMPEKKVDAVQTQTKVASLDVVKCQMAKDKADWLKKDLIKLPNDNISRVDMPLNISPPRKHITLPHNSEFSVPAYSCQLPRQGMRIIKQESKTGEYVCDNATNILQNVKNNSFSWCSTSIIEDKGQRDVIVSPEALDLCDSPPPPLAIQITCSVQENSKSFLELPKPLPVDLCEKGIVELKQNLVLLRDPAGRLWPVIYHQRRGFKALVSGWKEFRKSNGIRPGDKCTFLVENFDEGIMQVQIDSQFPSH